MTSDPPTDDRHWPFEGEGDDPATDPARVAVIDDDPPPAPATPPRRRRLSGFTIAGLALLIAGLSLLGWVGYQYVGTNVVSEQQFDTERTRLRSEWSNPLPEQQREAQALPPLPGNVMALMRIPALGADYEIPLVQGTTPSALSKGIGVYDSSAAPGAIGNFAVAGHRVTNGEPFRNVLQLKAGDQVIVETRDSIYTYVLDTSPADLTVDESEGWVIGPVPGKPTQTPTEALITLTTCTDLFHSPDRSVGFGHLESVERK